jgi:hypothetical protein
VLGCHGDSRRDLLRSITNGGGSGYGICPS